VVVEGIICFTVASTASESRNAFWGGCEEITGEKTLIKFVWGMTKRMEEWRRGGRGVNGWMLIVHSISR
jgi:hypothetical protein